MQDNLIRSGNAFFAPAGDNQHEIEPYRSMDNANAGGAKMTENMKRDNTNENNAGSGEGGDCGYRTGDLPECAPLAAGYVPWQRSAEPVYDMDDALTRGTLFPGLDLPFMDIANKGNPYAGTHLGDLMAVSFVSHELKLYLDTHTKDREAFALLKKMLALKKEAHARYVKMHGPISIDDLLEADTFTWTHGPWPWEPRTPGTAVANAGIDAAERK